MSRSFSPRSLDTDAWKGWNKDALRLLGRAGVFTVAAWGLVFVGLAFGLNHLTAGTVGYLLALLFMQFVGVFTQPLIQRSLDQLANGQRLNVGLAFTEAMEEIQSNRSWFGRRMAGQVAAMVALMSIMVVMVLLASSDASSSDAVRDPLNPVVNFLVHLVLIPTILRNHGLMDFDYWLRARHRIDPVISNALFNEARTKNRLSMFYSVMGFVVLFIGGSQIPLLALVVLPIIQWYHAAYTRCAYHDIFEDGTGLKAPVAQTANDTSLVPVLQA